MLPILHKYIFLMLFLSALQLSNSYRVLNYNEEKDEVESIQRIDEYKNNELEFSDENIIERSKRFINFGNSQSGRENQACQAPGNRTGHCKLLNYCVLEEMWSSYMDVRGYFCIVDTIYFGICCPDKTSNETIPEKAPVDPNNAIEISDRHNANLQVQECGFSNKSRTRIVGGRPADPKDWPWMAALLRDGDGEAQFCGGVLISNRHVLTAAHCTYGMRAQQIQVRLGEYDFTKTDETNSRDFRVMEITMYPGFNDSSYINDISILKLYRTIRFDEYIWPICLPAPDDSFANKTATVTGWGSVGFAEAFSDVLMEVDIPIWPHKMCQATYRDSVVPETSLCAGGWRGGKDSCQGDSGGPLMHKLSTGRWVTVGIVSWGKICGRAGQPGIYTRVNRYLSWITENIAT